MAFVEEFDDVRGGHAAEFVKHGLGHFRPVLAERGLPRTEVRGHGVGEGAVAIEDVGGEIAGRQFQGKRCGGSVCHGAQKFGNPVAFAKCGFANAQPEAYPVAIRFGWKFRIEINFTSLVSNGLCLGIS